MTDDLRSRLRGERIPALWRDLEPHARRDHVFLAAETLDLVEVAAAMAENDAPRVQDWLAGGLLRRPLPDEMRAWHDVPGTMFQMIIVAPFVLAQVTAAPPVEVEDRDPEPTIEEFVRFAREAGSRREE